MVSGSENDLHSWWVASVLDMIVFYNFAKSDIFIMRIIAFISIILDMFHRRKFRSQTSDNMDRWKAELGRGREKRRVEERRSEKRKSQKKADADARKGRKVAKHCVFPMIWGSRGSKSRLAKAAGAEPAGQMRDEKLHAVVARSTFRSQNVQSTAGPDHFWQLRCRKSLRRCGAKHISKSKCTKHTTFGPLLEVQIVSRGRQQGIVHIFKSEQNVRVSSHFQKRWQAWDIWRGSAKMHFPWQAQYKRHVHERC